MFNIFSVGIKGLTPPQKKKNISNFENDGWLFHYFMFCLSLSRIKTQNIYSTA